MHRAGFVLAGGHSSRMGRDKALLPYGSVTLIERVASQVAEGVGFVALVGRPATYGRFGYPVYADLQPECGPLGGLNAVLNLRLAEWNLLVACDMPRVTGPILKALMNTAESVDNVERACVAVTCGGSLQPLCAVYHATCRAVVEQAITSKQLKMMDLLSELRTVPWPAPDPEAFLNVNTPEEWATAERNAL